jgi:hypothetical protein
MGQAAADGAPGAATPSGPLAVQNKIAGNILPRKWLKPFTNTTAAQTNKPYAGTIEITPIHHPSALAS